MSSEMKDNKNEILNLVYAAIDEVNEDLPNNAQLVKSKNTKLFGEFAVLDSLQLVNFIVEVESLINDRFDIDITIADEKAFSQKTSPFLSVESLFEYICHILEESNI